MKMKKLSTIILSVAMLSTLLSGCGSKTAENTPSPTDTPSKTEVAAPSEQKASSEPVTISFYGGWTGPDLDRMTSLVNKFNESHPDIKVEFTSLQWSQIFAKFLADYQSGSSPEILAMHTFEMGQFVDMGVLDADAIEGIGLNKDDYLSTPWEGTILNGRQYAVPLDINMHALFYNTELFEKAGITSPPTNKEEFIAAAQKLTLDSTGKNPTDPGFNKDDIVQYGLGFNMNHHVFYQAYGLMNQQGYNPFTEDMTSISFDQDKAGAAFQFLEDLIFKYQVVPVGEKSPIDDFKAGTVAMIIDGNWQLAGLETADVKWATAVYPQIFEEKAVWGASDILTIPLSKNPDAAKTAAAGAFVKWMAENAEEWAESGQLPANKAAFETSKTMPGRQAFIDEIEYTKFLSPHPLATQIFSSSAPSPILTAAQSAVLNNNDVKDIIPQFEKDINAVLGQ